MSDKGMSNKEYLEKQKYAFTTESNDVEYRKVRALEIIAEELIHTREFLCGLTTIYKDLVIDVNKLKGEKEYICENIVIKPVIPKT